MLKKTMKVLSDNEFKRGTTRRAVRNLLENSKVVETWIDLRENEFVIRLKSIEDAINAVRNSLQYIAHGDMYYRVEEVIYINNNALFGTTIGVEDMFFLNPKNDE